jgi:hypothetical protein
MFVTVAMHCDLELPIGPIRPPDGVQSFLLWLFLFNGEAKDAL